mmetsp:Transcript_90848/g.229012  ORF Transcript_90848/g.229012 Transcript_90848/m.229012 type:complete len:224 (-) Transcript_90848:613-1284(-)
MHIQTATGERKTLSTKIGAASKLKKSCELTRETSPKCAVNSRLARGHFCPCRFKVESRGAQTKLTPKKFGCHGDVVVVEVIVHGLQERVDTLRICCKAATLLNLVLQALQDVLWQRTGTAVGPGALEHLLQSFQDHLPGENRFALPGNVPAVASAEDAHTRGPSSGHVVAEKQARPIPRLCHQTRSADRRIQDEAKLLTSLPDLAIENESLSDLRSLLVTVGH